MWGKLRRGGGYVWDIFQKNREKGSQELSRTFV